MTRFFSHLNRSVLLIETLCLCVIIFCQSCRTNIIELNAEYDIVTTTFYNPALHGFQPHYSIDEKNGHIYSSGLRWRTKDYLKYDLTSGSLIDSIDVGILPNNAIYDATIIGAESIIITQSTNIESGNHDNCILLIDKEKNVLDTISAGLYTAPVAMKQKQDIPLSDKYYVSLVNTPICYTNGMMYISLKPSDWDNTTSQNRDSLGGILIIKPHKEFIRLPIKSGRIDAKEYFWSPFQLESKGVAYKDHIFSFLVSNPIIYKYNTREKTLTQKRIRMLSVPKINPYKKGERYIQDDPYKSEYKALYLDSIHKQLICVARIACDSTIDGPVTTQYKNSVYSFSLMDFELNKIAEGIVPAGYAPNFIPYKDGYLLYKISSVPETYTYFTCRYIKGTHKDLLKPVLEKRNKLNAIAPRISKTLAIKQYANKIVGKDSSKYQRYIIIPETSCPTCIPVYGKVIQNNRRNLMDKKTAIILITSDLSTLTDFKYSIYNSETIHGDSFIYADTNNLYQRYMESWVNLRYIEYDNTGNIVTDMIVNPKDIPNFNAKLQENTR